MKLDIVKVAKIAGTVLSLAGTVLVSWSTAKDMHETVAKEVEKALVKQN